MALEHETFTKFQSLHLVFEGLFNQMKAAYPELPDFSKPSEDESSLDDLKERTLRFYQQYMLLALNYEIELARYRQFSTPFFPYSTRLKELSKNGEKQLESVVSLQEMIDLIYQLLFVFSEFVNDHEMALRKFKKHWKL